MGERGSLRPRARRDVDRVAHRLAADRPSTRGDDAMVLRGDRRDGAVGVRSGLGARPAARRSCGRSRSGSASAAFIASANAITQQECPPDMRSRLLALQAVAFLGSTPIGGPLTGLIADNVSAEWALGLQQCDQPGLRRRRRLVLAVRGPERHASSPRRLEPGRLRRPARARHAGGDGSARSDPGDRRGRRRARRSGDPRP